MNYYAGLKSDVIFTVRVQLIMLKNMQGWIVQNVMNQFIIDFRELLKF